MQNHTNLVNLLNSTNANANAKPGTRTNAQQVPEISFNQVLSREIAERPKAAISAPPTPPAPNKTPGPVNANNSNTASASKANNNANNANSANSANSSNNVNKSPDSSAPPAPAEKSASGKTDDSSSGQASSSVDDANNPAQNDTQAASQLDPTAALLALVNSVGNTASTSTQASSTTAVAGASDTKSNKTERTDSRASAKVASAGDVAALTPVQAGDSASVTPVLDLANASTNDSESASQGQAKAGEPKLVSVKAEPANVDTKANAPATPAEPFAAVHAAATAQRTQGTQGDAPTSTKETAPTPIAAVKLSSAVDDTPALAKFQQVIAPRVGNPGWDQALGQRVVYMAGANQQTASLTLNPPDLGPLQVVLTISNDQTSASFTAAQPEVRQALEAAMPKLREMMSEAGIQLGSATVSTSMPNQQQSQQQSTPGEQSRSGTQSGQFEVNGLDTSGKTVKTTIVHDALGLVDTFA